MKILYWTPQFWPEIGGIQTIAMQTLLALTERGYDFLIVTSLGRTEQRELGEYHGLPIRRFPFWNALAKNDVGLIQNTIKQIVDLKRSFAPDLIHINFSGYTAFFQQMTARYQPAPTLISLHGDLSGLENNPATVLVRLFQNADWVTAVSETVLAKARRLLPGIVQRSSVVYGTTAIPAVEPLPLPVEKPCLVAIGRLVHEKGFDLLLEAVPSILARFPNLSVKLIGDGPERLALEQQAVNLGLQECVEFTGSVPHEDIPTQINTASLVIIPSRYLEAFGLVALEAAWMARPVVATNIGGLAEVVVDGETGRLVTMEAPATLAQAVIDLLTNPATAIQMGRAARARVQEKFSFENHVQAYDGLYRSLIRERVQ